MNNNDLVTFSLPKNQIYQKIGLRKVCFNYGCLRSTKSKVSYLMATANYPATLSCPLLIIFLLFVDSAIIEPPWDQGPDIAHASNNRCKHLGEGFASTPAPLEGSRGQLHPPPPAENGLQRARHWACHIFLQLASEQEVCFLTTGWKMIDALPWEACADAQIHSAAASSTSSSAGTASLQIIFWISFQGYLSSVAP